MRVLVIISFIVLSIGFLANAPADDTAMQFDRYYTAQLNCFKQSVFELDKTLAVNNSIAMQRTVFLKVRYAYKRLSVLTDYLNPYETILLNSAAVARIEDDNPTNIIAPHGLQQLEALIWAVDETTQVNEDKVKEIAYVNAIITDLQNEPGRINKFTDANVWQALRNALITIITKTITSLETPMAQNALSECKASLESIANIILIFKNTYAGKAAGYYKNINLLIANALTALEQQHDFISFDRLSFIKNNINPLSSQLTEAAVRLTYINEDERFPVHPAATNIFAKDAFDVNFFSPNKRYQFTEDRMLLGKQLFNDPKLSGDQKRSCATCHKPALAFSDGLKTALAVDNKTFLPRNTPTLLNAVFQTKQFYDSRATMLEFQINSVVHNNLEMGGSTENMVAEIKKDKQLTAQFRNAYPNEKDTINRYIIANAIATYMRSLQSLNARFDKYMRNEGIELSAPEKNGFNLFMGKAKCGTCHFIPLFNGLVPPQFNDTESEVLGVPSTAKKPYLLDADSGKYYFTKSIVHLYAFKTPTLRNIALTTPYMHNGVYKTLDEVLDFYNNGGGKGLGIAPPNQSLSFDKLHLTKSDKKELIAFLKTLTDTTSYKRK